MSDDQARIEKQKEAVAAMKNTTANARLLIERVELLERSLLSMATVAGEAMKMIPDCAYRNPETYPQDKKQPACLVFKWKIAEIKNQAGL